MIRNSTQNSNIVKKIDHSNSNIDLYLILASSKQNKSRIIRRNIDPKYKSIKKREKNIYDS